MADSERKAFWAIISIILIFLALAVLAIWSYIRSVAHTIDVDPTMLAKTLGLTFLIIIAAVAMLKKNIISDFSVLLPLEGELIVWWVFARNIESVKSQYPWWTSILAFVMVGIILAGIFYFFRLKVFSKADD